MTRLRIEYAPACGQRGFPLGRPGSGREFAVLELFFSQSSLSRTAERSIFETGLNEFMKTSDSVDRNSRPPLCRTEDTGEAFQHHTPRLAAIAQCQRPRRRAGQSTGSPSVSTLLRSAVTS